MVLADILPVHKRGSLRVVRGRHDGERLRAGPRRRERVEKTFGAEGGKVVKKTRAPFKTPNVGPFMQKFKTFKPDAVFVFGPSRPTTFAIIKAYSEAGLRQANIRLIGTGDTSELDLPSIGDAAPGLETALHHSPAHVSTGNQAYMKAMGEVAPSTVVNAVAVGAFDGMAVIYRMIEATDGQRDGARSMAAARGYAWESPRGPLKIDAGSRELVQNVYVRTVDRDEPGKLRNRKFMTFEAQLGWG